MAFSSGSHSLRHRVLLGTQNLFGLILYKKEVVGELDMKAIESIYHRFQALEMATSKAFVHKTIFESN
ncbi:hypothetical protein [Caldalkalibacillus mannanilyticus]|uniref:hypothetical protein n=1 Tax=Caldalkalibacillus mannanilyticus TaxID=1418 RepID=UPI00046A7F4D|nr:hypothetical protein [Caldalkalibacillus mannanilyticus]